MFWLNSYYALFGLLTARGKIIEKQDNWYSLSLLGKEIPGSKIGIEASEENMNVVG